MNKKGFTLIELLIVIAIIGVLAAIGIPAYIGQQRTAARTEAHTNLQNLRLLEEQVFADIGCYPLINPGLPGACPSPAGSIGAAGSATATRDANLPLIQAVLTRFRPGPSTGLNYSYRIIQNQSMTAAPTVPWNGANAAQTPCFIAVATGVVGTRVAGDVFAIDCNNNRNF
jgi:prepilin-type N-terminal cleavage/methylation domain-containing protein